MSRAAGIRRYALAGLVVAVTACAGQPGAGTGAPASSTGVPPAPRPSAPAATSSPAPSQVPPTSRPSASTQPPPGPSGQAKPITVRGRVVVGIVPDCLRLVTDTSQYILVGAGLEALGTGDRVEVEAVPAQPGEAACGGDALRVRKLRRV